MAREPMNKHDWRPPMRGRQHIDVVLVEPQKPENIGTVARAMANTGLGRLVVVRPRTLNRELMAAAATTHAQPVLEGMAILPKATLAEAVAGYGLVIGTTARVGNRRGPFYTPREIAPTLLAAPEGGQPSPTALVFGSERNGLSTEDLHLCQKVVRIPTECPETSSLNLAQAVLILGYELLLAAGGEVPASPVAPASQAELAAMYGDLSDTLQYIGFLPADNPGHWLMNVKKIFNRSLLTAGECNLWRGVCRQIRWALRHPGQLPPGPSSSKPSGA